MGLIAYKIAGSGKGKQSRLILIQTESGEGNVPRRAAKIQIEKAALDFEKAMEPVAAVAQSVLKALKAAAPGKVTIKFGIELGGKLGIPLVTEGSGKANFEVQLTWEGQKGKEEKK